jgi:hypothetical protein
MIDRSEVLPFQDIWHECMSVARIDRGERTILLPCALGAFPLSFSNCVYHSILRNFEHSGRNNQRLDFKSNDGNGPDVAPCSACLQVAGFGGFAVLIFGVNSVGLAMLAFKALVTPATDTANGD